MEVFSNAIRNIKLQLQEVNSLLTQCEAATYYLTQKIFIDKLREDLEECYLDLEDIGVMISDCPDLYPINDVYPQICSLQKQVALISNRTNIVRSSRFELIPWSAIGMIHSLKNIIAPAEELVVTSSTLSTYRIWKPIKSDGAQKSDTISILEIPYLYRRNAFLHILVAHELFHLRADDFLASIREQALNSIRECWDELIQQKKHSNISVKSDSEVELDNTLLFNHTSEQKSKKKEDDKERIVNKTVEIFNSTLKEILCDIGCFAIFGPSAFLALHQLNELNTDRSININSDNYHPPFEQRMRILIHLMESHPLFSASLNELKEKINDDARISQIGLRFFDKLNSGIKEIKTERKVDSTQSLYYYILHISKSEVDKFIDKACDFVTGVIDHTEESWIGKQTEISDHIYNFSKFSPSGFKKNASDFSMSPSSNGALGLAAWINNLGRDFLPDKEEDLNVFLTDCNILFKSWDDAEVIKEWPVNGTD
ncbi:hypothetical protein Patl_0328 [Paraglaciecola sp. T6c]|uniref:hypothetical protein n=1 Tax=Pseudoalteromonas atlantica (strain T6c / ATCC BAA-1087) TaxID=3042615 RepID=UPI00005C6A35|nr:hypothetical protein [Paraglaciecola sp. T6c]ABG38859.1 hypothetical protein Patl_0328 [Paraglaciecola sp. T6c]